MGENENTAHSAELGLRLSLVKCMPSGSPGQMSQLGTTIMIIPITCTAHAETPY